MVTSGKPPELQSYSVECVVENSGLLFIIRFGFSEFVISIVETW